MQSSFIAKQEAAMIETQRVFITAYHIAKHDRPYVDHPHLIDLQVKNGLKLGRVLHNPPSCVDIIDHIAANMRVRLIEALKLSACSKMAVLIDDSTSLSSVSCLIIYIRCCFDECSPVTFFLISSNYSRQQLMPFWMLSYQLFVCMD